MTERNPMKCNATRVKMSKTLKEINHQPPWRGGNGTGPTKMEVQLHSQLPWGWLLNYIEPTKIPRGNGYPTHYKLDIANPLRKIAVEIDGGSHYALTRRAQDEKKSKFLESRGWSVLRFTNDEIATALEACVQRILSTTSK
jgi:hypothetical protein